jgi:hypothetical protein
MWKLRAKKDNEFWESYAVECDMLIVCGGVVELSAVAGNRGGGGV